VVTHLFQGEERPVFQAVLSALAQKADLIAALANRDGENAQWAICATIDGFDFEKAREELLDPIGGKGGGRPPIWQGVARRPGGLDEFLLRFRQMAS
jgi:alanyl-tRNA synthetase